MNFIKKGLITIFNIAIISLLTSCASTEKTPENYEKEAEIETNKLESLALQKYKENFVFHKNSSNTFVLCIKQDKSPNSPVSKLTKYFLYDLDIDELIFEETIANGTVEWLNDHQIRVSLIPGIVRGDEKREAESNSYIFDLKLKKKIHSKSPIPGIKDSE